MRPLKINKPVLVIISSTSHPSSSRSIVEESYSIVAIFHCVACHPLICILAALDCGSHDSCTASKVNLQRIILTLFNKVNITTMSTRVPFVID